MKGWLHWRLLGALTKGDARAAYSRRIVAPSSEKKMGLEVRDMRRGPCLSTAPLGCRSARAGCKRLRLR